jgi:hypothetical protein
MGERVVNFLFERLMPFFEFRKMRFNRHVASLLASDCSLIGISYTLTIGHEDTPLFAVRKSPLCTVREAARGGLVGD